MLSSFTNPTPNNRPVIQQLNPTLINQIAAGEVIERPAAALKELVENAIDAKANSIDIVLRDGGKSLIQVTDNGVGMTEADLMLAIQRHATSKLPTGDLFNITTLGFRGEALPSIGSVSRLTITSFPANSAQTMARELFIEGGDIHPIRPAAHPTPGTRITIKDLFYATPARLKFLKTDATEMTACLDMVKRLALAHPQVAFSCTADGKEMLKLVSRETLGQRFSDILTSKTLENVRLCDGERDGIKLTGVISLPTFHKSQASDQFFFVNNRPVKDKLFMGVLKVAYQDYLEKGRHPVVALFVTVDPAEVDVNVHPTKAEVRFRDSQGVRSLLIGTLKATLHRHGQEASSQLAGEAIARFQSMPAQNAYVPTAERSLSNNYSPSPSTASIYPQSGLQHYSGQGITTGAQRLGQFSPGRQAITPGHSLTPYRNDLQEEKDTHTYPYQNQPLLNLAVSDTSFPAPPPEGTDLSAFGEEGASIKDHYPLGLAKAQIGDSYILSETATGIILTDQHAAHERVRYERLKAHYLQKGVAKQLLLVPFMLPIEPSLAEILTRNMDSLHQLGFDLDCFGDEVVIRGVPALLAQEDPSQLIPDLLKDLCDEDAVLSVSDKLLEFLATHACHTSIRAGDSLSIPEMNALLRDMEATPNSGQCNHGRPTYVNLSLGDIERLFGRK